MLKSSTSRPRPTKLRKCISSSKAESNSDDDSATTASPTAAVVRQVQFRIMHPDQRQRQREQHAGTTAMGGAQQQQQPPVVVGNRCCSLKRSAPGKSPDLTTYATGLLTAAASTHRPELAYAKLQQQAPAAALAPASSAVSSCCSSMTASASSATIPTSTATMLLKKSSSAATLCSPSKEWAALLADSNSSDEDDEDDRTASSTLSSGASDADSSMEEDSDNDNDNDNNDNEDEEETRMAKMLVNAAFSRTMSSTQLANILCQPSPRKKQRMNPNMQELLERQPSLQSLQPNSKQPPSPSLVRMIQSAPSLAAAAATSQQRQQQALLAQRQQAGAAGVAGGMPPHLQEQLVQHQQRQWTIRPQDFLRALLKKRGYPHDTMVPASKLENFFVPITAESVASYDMQTVKAVRAEDVDTLRRLGKERGHGRLQCGNKFGESIVHTAARRGSAAVLRFLFEEAGVSAAVCCDAGRTPLHDACWSAQPNFKAVAILLEYGRDLLYIQDARGFTPLQYVPRDQWKSWCKFLHERPTAAQLAPTAELLQQATNISAAAAAAVAPGPATSLAAGAAVAVSG